MTHPSFDDARITAEFPFAREVSYLNTAAEGLLPRTGRDVLLRYADAKARGEPGRVAMYETEERLRRRAADWLEARPDQVTFLPSAARGVGAVLEAIDWRAGDSIVTSDAEFPTNVVGPLALGRRGVETQVLRSAGGRYPHAGLEAALEAQVRLVIVSAVSFRTGFRPDLSRIAEVIRARAPRALLLVDATQAFGVVPVTLAPADVVVASTFKWALSIHGATVLALADTARDLLPATPGWRALRDLFAPDRFERVELRRDARRFDEGMPAFAAEYVLESTLDLLEGLGREAISRRVAEHVARIDAGLHRLGIETLSSPDPTRRAGIVAFEMGEAANLAAKLAGRAIVVFGRANVLRLSPHLYTSDADVELLLAALAEFSAGA